MTYTADEKTCSYIIVLRYSALIVLCLFIRDYEWETRVNKSKIYSKSCYKTIITDVKHFFLHFFVLYFDDENEWTEDKWWNIFGLFMYLFECIHCKTMGFNDKLGILFLLVFIYLREFYFVFKNIKVMSQSKTRNSII